jgi:hypothetical protein
MSPSTLAQGSKFPSGCNDELNILPRNHDSELKHGGRETQT